MSTLPVTFIPSVIPIPNNQNRTMPPNRLTLLFIETQTKKVNDPEPDTDPRFNHQLEKFLLEEKHPINHRLNNEILDASEKSFDELSKYITANHQKFKAQNFPVMFKQLEIHFSKSEEGLEKEISSLIDLVFISIAIERCFDLDHLAIMAQSLAIIQPRLPIVWVIMYQAQKEMNNPLISHDNAVINLLGLSTTVNYYHPLFFYSVYNYLESSFNSLTDVQKNQLRSNLQTLRNED